MSALRDSFFRHVARTSKDSSQLLVSRGQGIYLYDESGTAHIDCISGIAVSSLGHNHPRIIATLEQQLHQYLHTHVYGEQIVAPQVKLAEKLASLLPSQLSVTYFVNSGAEAVEGALKLVRKYTGRYEIVACRNAYHGSTAGAESLRSDLHYTASSRPLVPGIRHILFNEAEDLDYITESTAAVIIEPIQGEAGVFLPNQGYLKKVEVKCKAVGALLIIDEIQTGMGRTGRMWAFEEEGVMPDILLLAKAFGGGLPLGAFISSPAIMDVFSHDPPLGHLTTFGGNALCCAGSLEAINIIIDEKLDARAASKFDFFKKQLEQLKIVKEVRGRGLMIAIELDEPAWLQRAIDSCKKNGLLVDWFLFNNNSIRFYPPLIVTDDESSLICEKFEKSFSEIEA
jgi:acetylornithine/succinyldiaminopimelate/putrescine aminotransferase